MIDISGRTKKLITYLIIFIAVPVIIAVGTIIFSDRQYIFISTIIAVCSCIPLFISFEKKDKGNTQKLVILAVMTALSALGRFAFMYIPSFKPVTAIVIICGMYMGAEFGFLCGALSAFLSNFIFMQGPWTPFQMFIWGSIGFASSFFAPLLKKSKLAVVIYGIFAGVFYSAFMDIWTVLWWDGTFNLERYAAALVTSLPTLIVYALSNVCFLLLLTKPIGKKLERMKSKYGI